MDTAKHAKKAHLKYVICMCVTALQGCKATKLIASLEPSILLEFEGDEITSYIEELVNEGRLIEISYTLPNMEYREKSFLLPGGSVVSMSTNTNNTNVEQ